jgi:hypothetical protein
VDLDVVGSSPISHPLGTVPIFVSAKMGLSPFAAIHVAAVPSDTKIRTGHPLGHSRQSSPRFA